MADIDVTTSGPFFNGRAQAEIAQMCREAEDEIAAQTYAEVMTNLNTSIRIPTPYYETQIANERLTVGRRIHDRGIVYGPFLESGPHSGEGPTPRPSSFGRPNAKYPPSSGFRGYHSFGRAYATMRARARELALHAIQRHIGRM